MVGTLGYQKVANASVPGIDLAENLRSYQVQLIGISAIAILFSLGFSYLLTRSVANPTRLLVRTMSDFEAGHLSRRARVDSTDELGQLAIAFNGMADRLEALQTGLEQRLADERATVQTYVDYMAEISRGNLSACVALSEKEDTPQKPLVVLGHNLNDMAAGLKRMTLQVRDAASDLNSASAEILAATSQQATGATEQSTAIAQASSTIDQVRTIAQQASQRMQRVANLAQQTAQVSTAGQQAIADTITGVQAVRDKVETIAGDVLALSEQSQAIGQIIATVNRIASQSNMLALNAAVEAARAGEAGHGFAVVAQEVRSLARQSKAATEQIREILTEVQTGVNTVVMATEEGMKGADVGIKLVGEAGLAIQRLNESVSESTQSTLQSATAAGQQLIGMEQIAQAMEHIHQVTTQSVISSQQVKQAAGELDTLAGQLRELVEQYQL